ncbi:uncharacterized protein LOC122576646 [Bombus pyrosoma]|uniref:uncharacterized protein LOC122576646 n=1 Tax=Bombus pyrosoma TaxID=396416 RepID=UPI001CB9882F|nr:uncharacterized protein LOC122576646 [Bombus pyrosoma]
MAHADQISTLRRRRSAFIGRMTLTKRERNDYEANGQVDKYFLASCHQAFKKNWRKIMAVKDELEGLDAEESERLVPISQEHRVLETRILNLIEQSQTSIRSRRPKRESITESEPTPIKLPDILLIKFSGHIEEWEYFYDTFTANVDCSENLTLARKFQYLRSCVTGTVARSIRSLEVTATNYPVVLKLLKEEFDYHRLRRWEFIKYHSKITWKLQKP